ncbi:CCN family member 5 isoform X4 [Gallus gallus]|uniref:CCN family member 5 isoform X4 n=1 Tax=Gallus gallus TaxID=9031 RepID=UPI001F01A51E|nr:CCN family member 5 isoform X4 [Gallus gallus]
MRDWQCCSPWRVKWLSCEDTRLPKKVSLLIGFLYFYRNSRASQEMYLDPCTNCFLAQLTTKKETTNLTVIPREPQGTNCGMNPSHEMTRVVQNTYGVRGESKSTPCASNPAPACVLSCWGLHIALLLLLCHRSQGKKSTFGTRRACLASPAHWQAKVNPTEQRGSILPSALGFRALWVTYPSPIAVPWGSVKYGAGFPALLSLGSVPGWMSGEQPPPPIRSPAERCWLCLAAHARQPPSAMPVPLGMCPLSLPFSCSPSRQHALTLRGVEMSAGMWAGKKRKQILRLVQTYSCLYWSLGVTSERGEYKHQQDPLGALKPANMRLRLEKQLLILSLLCILSKVCSQLCRRPCYCSQMLPRCPRGSPLVLDGCGCCRICARRLGEPCDFLHVCDRSQGLICDYSSGTGGTCNFEDNEEGCEVNGRLYRDGEVFQPSCKLQCRCLDGGFTCVPLCQEDVRLPTPDCPHPRRVDIPGKCCPEWVCEAGEWHLLQSTGAARAVPYPCQPWGTEWSACSATCGVGFSTRVSNQNPYCRLETQRRLCVLRPCLALPVASPARG